MGMSLVGPNEEKVCMSSRRQSAAAVVPGKMSLTMTTEPSSFEMAMYCGAWSYGFLTEFKEGAQQ